MMLNDAPRPAQAAIRTDLGAIFVSMELSRRTWLITSLSPGAGEKMSKHSVPASDVPGLLHRFAELKRKATARSGRDFPSDAAGAQTTSCARRPVFGMARRSKPASL
jgi:transposase